MPSRIVRDGILESEAINSLSWEAELFFRRLMSIVDDFGRYNALPMLLRSRCYPLQFDKVTDKTIGEWLKACSKAKLIKLYKVENKPYLEVLNFKQRTRQNCSKFPAPDGCNTDDGHLPANVGGARSTAHEGEGEDEGEFVNEGECSSRKMKLPKGWKPNESHEKIAAERKIDLEVAASVFRDWAKGSGKMYVDWDATFRNALRKWLHEHAALTRTTATDATGAALKKWK